MSSDDRTTKTKRRPRSTASAVHGKKQKSESDKIKAEASSQPKLLPPGPLPHPHAWRRRTVLIALPVLGVVLMTWLAGNLYFMQFTIAGTKVRARSSSASLEQLAAKTADTYRLKVVDPEGKVSAYTFEDVGIRPDAKATVISLRHQQHAWPARLQWWRPIAVHLQLHSDTTALQTFAKAHAARTVEPAKDASITLENGEVKLAEGTTGKQYGLANPTSAILSAAERLQTTPLRMHQVPLSPTITAAQLASVRDSLDRTLHQKVAIGVGDQTTTPEPKDIAAWIKLIPDATRKTVNVESNKEAIQAYLDKIAAASYQPPKAQLTNGSAVIPGVTGIRVTGTQTVANTLTDKLLTAGGLTVDLPVVRTPFKTVSAPLAGRWIVVDLTTKRMYAYQQTSLVKSFLVSAGAPATPTPTGRYAIYSKFVRQTMTGPNADGSRYTQPNVPWINYFYQDYAIHGNYWRPTSYFGNINSSHGCVGVTPSDGAWIYNWALIGTPVIIHA